MYVFLSSGAWRLERGGWSVEAGAWRGGGSCNMPPCTGYAYPLYLKGNRSALADINPPIPAKHHATHISGTWHQGWLAREEDRKAQPSLGYRLVCIMQPAV